MRQRTPQRKKRTPQRMKRTPQRIKNDYLLAGADCVFLESGEHRGAGGLEGSSNRGLGSLAPRPEGSAGAAVMAAELWRNWPSIAMTS